jgi:cytochrome P450
MRLMEEVDALLFEEIRRRRAAPDDGRTDILSMLVAARDEAGQPMTEQELRDELMTLLLAGHETTATALAWAVYHVLRHPDVLVRLRRELDEVIGDEALTDAHLPKLRYLDAVVKETLRLTPVIPMVGRKLRTPMRICGYDMPAGTVLVPSSYLTHRRPDVWSDPERFDPTRFVDAKADPYAFYPFGGGTRRCIGAAFAMFEAKIVLAEVLRLCELELEPGYVATIAARAVTFAPKGGVRVRVRDRRQNQAA